MTGLQGIEIARRLALMGAETVVGTPKELLPFDDSGPGSHAARWSEIGLEMSDHESSDDAALARLRDGFALGPLEYWLVMLCGAVERYAEAAVSIGILMDAQHAHLVTPLAFAQLMRAARGVPVEESLCASLGGGMLSRLGLVEVAETQSARPLSHQTIRLSSAEMLALFGGPPGRGEKGAAARGDTFSAAFDETLIRVATNLLEQSRLLCLRGSSPRAMRQFACDMAGWLDLEPRMFPAGDGPLDLTPLLRLRSQLPVLDMTGVHQPSHQARLALSDAQPAVRRLIVLASDGFPATGIASFTVPRLGWQESERIWRAATSDSRIARRLASRFRVSLAEAATACSHADQLIAAGEPGHTAAREQLIARLVLEEGERSMGRLVSHLRSEAQLADLVVQEPLLAQLLDILDWQRHSARVFGEMGLGRRSPLGRGLTCLFSGPPGTGKTFAAQCIANELGLNLYRIDLSQVVSKYIGETEKALATVFDEAEAGHGVLLFDECDALFGKRSEVKDAHDRYANIEVGYLLQRIEAYEGVAILATNLRSNMDSAFLRRIRFLLDFPMPDAAMRRRLWEQSLPGEKFRSSGLDVDLFVERFRLSGGSIQNIGLAAAHMAAATESGRITVDHLVRATYRELEKAGQSRDRSSFGPLAEYLPAEVA